VSWLTVWLSWWSVWLGGRPVWLVWWLTVWSVIMRDDLSMLSPPFGASCVSCHPDMVSAAAPRNRFTGERAMRFCHTLQTPQRQSIHRFQTAQSLGFQIASMLCATRWGAIHLPTAQLHSRKRNPGQGRVDSVAGVFTPSKKRDIANLNDNYPGIRLRSAPAPPWVCTCMRVDAYLTSRDRRLTSRNGKSGLVEW
jgi:hypothetical protein